VAYARSDASTGQGHLLDLYLPPNSAAPTPVVVFSRGSAWFADNGREGAQALAAALFPAGYAMAGVSIRSSRQAKVPAQVHDIKAAIRWLRANAAKYDLDPRHVAVIGESSGGWTAAMAAVTGDVPELEGREGTTGPSSAIQAAVAFYPPTDFLQMDSWALQRCDPAVTLGARGAFCHDAPSSPESQLVGCAIQSCAEKARAANPITYVSAADAPIMIVHGGTDPLVPHAQGELLYQALNKACRDAVFISMPVAGHGVWVRMMSDPALATAATRRSTSSAGCAVQNPQPHAPSWATVIEFLDRYMK
jgi:acetyl esterase/lipase